MHEAKLRRNKDSYSLSQAHIKKSEPILQGLQRKSTKDESNTECPEPPLRKVVRVVFDIRIEGHPEGGHDTGHQSHTDREWPGVIDVMDERAADKRRSYVADSAYASPQEQRP
jgi:hypothetical protein